MKNTKISPGQNRLENVPLTKNLIVQAPPQRNMGVFVLTVEIQDTQRHVKERLPVLSYLKRLKIEDEIKPAIHITIINKYDITITEVKNERHVNLYKIIGYINLYAWAIYIKTTCKVIHRLHNDHQFLKKEMAT